MNLQQITTSLEDYLRSQFEETGMNVFEVGLTHNNDDSVQFVIHPLNRNGVTLDYSVKGNTVECVSQVRVD